MAGWGILGLRTGWGFPFPGRKRCRLCRAPTLGHVWFWGLGKALFLNPGVSRPVGEARLYLSFLQISLLALWLNILWSVKAGWGGSHCRHAVNDQEEVCKGWGLGGQTLQVRRLSHTRTALEQLWPIGALTSWPLSIGIDSIDTALTIYLNYS